MQVYVVYLNIYFHWISVNILLIAELIVIKVMFNNEFGYSYDIAIYSVKNRCIKQSCVRNSCTPLNLILVFMYL